MYPINWKEYSKVDDTNSGTFMYLVNTVTKDKKQKVIYIYDHRKSNYIRAFYHFLIDGLQDSIYDIGWKKDIYPEPEYLMSSITKGELFIGLIDNNIIVAMVINHESNEGYQNID